MATQGTGILGPRIPVQFTVHMCMTHRRCQVEWSPSAGLQRLSCTVTQHVPRFDWRRTCFSTSNRVYPFGVSNQAQTTAPAASGASSNLEVPSKAFPWRWPGMYPSHQGAGSRGFHSRDTRRPKGHAVQLQYLHHLDMASDLHVAALGGANLITSTPSAAISVAARHVRLSTRHEGGFFALQQRTEGLQWKLVHYSDKSGEIRKLQDERRVLFAASHRWKSIRFNGTSSR